MKYTFLAILVIVALAFAVTAQDAAPYGEAIITLKNHGGILEGHTPRGFAGSGTGLFAGDNLNPGFPEGEGVQIFLTFDLHELPEGQMRSAFLSSDNLHVSGTPFEDLGNLIVEEIRYDQFSAELWNHPIQDTTACIFASAQNVRDAACDVTEAVQHSQEDQYRYAQFRLRFEQPGDNDGQQDLAMFYIRDSNTNQQGIFDLEVTLETTDTRLTTPQNHELLFVNLFIVAIIITLLLMITEYKRNKRTHPKKKK